MWNAGNAHGGVEIPHRQQVVGAATTSSNRIAYIGLPDWLEAGMRRVVVTGIGVVSSIGNGKAEVLDALVAGKSGIAVQQEYVERGFRVLLMGKHFIL